MTALAVGESSEHQDLLQFLYSVSVGLVHASPDGHIEMINSAAAGWLMPLAPEGRLANLFVVLSAVAPTLSDAVASHGEAPGVIVNNLRIEIEGGRRRRGAEFISMTLSRVDGRRLMAVFNDVTQQVRDERALRDSEAHYRAVVSVLSEGIVLHDPRGKLLTSNAAAERILGAPLPPVLADSVLARGWTRLWPDGRPMAAAETPTGIVLAGGPPQEHVPVYSTSPSGEKRWFEVSAQPVIRPGTAELLAVVTSFTDVTQRQKLQDELRHHHEHLQELVTQRTRELESANAALSAHQTLYRAVADAVPGMIGYWDSELRCWFSNQAYLEWFGKTPDAMLGIQMQDLLGPELFALNQPHVEAALRGEVQHFQRSIRKPDGSVGHTLASYIPAVIDGRARGFSVVVTDVTDLKQAELRLADLNEQLLRRAAQSDEATQAKSAFLANMSHEIRTPMNAIVGLSHLMRREARDPVQQTRLEKINDASQHLLQLINDVLDLSKIEAGKMTLDDIEFDTQDLLTRAVGMVAGQAREKSLDVLLNCDGLPRRLRGDPVRLSQCLINLLGNAVKFTQHGWILLRGGVEFDTPHRTVVRFEVQDTGAGIGAESLPALFNAFEQADNSPTRPHGGTGLGLALTRHFARLMGGEAGVVSELGAGSTFWFTASLGVVAAASGTAAADGLRGVHVLLIDDDAGRRVAMEQSLLELGLEVDAPPGDADGLRRLAGEMTAVRPYALVIIERAMQPVDGIETFRSIRERWGAGGPPCLLVTAAGGDAAVSPADEPGFDAVLFRPIAPPALQEALYRVLRRRPPTAGPALPWTAEGEAGVLEKLSGRRVLLVEDNPVNQEVAVELLGLVGLVVETAGDGAHALELMRSRSYDIVLMDVQMPVMDGITATREIRKAGIRTPIIAMTANAFAEERAECLAAGMDDHVAKPVDTALLYAALVRWLLGPEPAAGAAASPSAADPGARTAVQAPALLERLAAVRGLDPNAALRTVGGRVGILERVMTRFCEVYAAGKGGLASDQEAPSIERLKANVHSLRGACGTIGATVLQFELARFERELDLEPYAEQQLPRAHALDVQLNQLLAQLKTALAG